MGKVLDPRLPVNRLPRSRSLDKSGKSAASSAIRALTTSGGGSGIVVGGGGGGAGGSVTVSDAPPTTPLNGDLWFDTVGTQLYIWYSDPNSSQWVVVVNTGGGVAGVDESIQYNKSGKAGGDANLLWDYARQQMTIVSQAAQAGLTVEKGYIVSDGGFITSSTDYNAITALNGGALLGLLGVNGGGTGQQLSASQVRITNGPFDNGIYMTCVGPSGGVFSAGAKYGGAQYGDYWTARDQTASLINLNGGDVDFYGDAGLTIGGQYLPSLLMTLDSGGNLTLNPGGLPNLHGGFIGPGTISNLTPPCVPFAATINTLTDDVSMYWQAANPPATPNSCYDGQNTPNMTYWLPRSTSASMMALLDGAINFYSDVNLTPSTAGYYAPTKVATIDVNGSLTVDDGKGIAGHSVITAAGGFVTRVQSFNAIQAITGGVVCSALGVNGGSQIPGTLPSASQVRVTNSTADDGIYLTCVGPSGGVFSAGGNYSGAGTQWTVKDTGTPAAASMVSLNGGGVYFYGDTGLNNLVTYPLYTPSLLMKLDPVSGNLTLNPNNMPNLSGAFVGAGTISGLTQNCVTFAASPTVITDNALFYWISSNPPNTPSASLTVPRLGVNGGTGTTGTGGAYPPATQVRVSYDGYNSDPAKADTGFYITTIGANDALIGAGARLDGLAPGGVTWWMARAAAASMIELHGSVINFWGDKNLTTGSYYLPASPQMSYDGSTGTLTVKNLTVNGTSNIGGGGLSGLTANCVPFASSSSALACSPNLTWDNVNNALSAYTLVVNSTAYNALQIVDSLLTPTTWGGVICGRLGVNGSNSSQARFSSAAKDSGMFLTSSDAHSAHVSAGIAFNGGIWVGKDDTGGAAPGTPGVGTIFSQVNGVFHWYSNSNIPYNQQVVTLTEMMSLDSQGNLVVGVASGTVGNLHVKGTITPGLYAGLPTMVNTIAGTKTGGTTPASGNVSMTGVGGITVSSTTTAITIDGSGIGGGLAGSLLANAVAFANTTGSALTYDTRFYWEPSTVAIHLPGLGVDGPSGASQVRISSAGAVPYGMFLTSTISNDAHISGGCSYNGSWVAHGGGSGVASIFQQYGGIFGWFSNTAVTEGNPFTPTEMMSLDAQGNLVVGVDPTTIGNLHVRGTLSVGAYSGLPSMVNSITATGPISGAVTLVGAGTVSVSNVGQTITITGAAGGVTSISAPGAMTGAITIVGGGATLVTNSGNTITISTPAGGTGNVTTGGLGTATIPFANSAVNLTYDSRFYWESSTSSTHMPALGLDGGSASQVRISSGGTVSYGMFLTSTISNDANISGGCSYNGSNWVARGNSSGVASIFQQYGGVFGWFSNTNLTEGSPFTATEMMSLDAQGSLVVGVAGTTIGNLTVRGKITAGSGIVASLTAASTGIVIGGAITLTGSGGITVTSSGQTITINQGASSAPVSSVSGSGNITVSPTTGSCVVGMVSNPTFSGGINCQSTAYFTSISASGNIDASGGTVSGLGFAAHGQGNAQTKTVTISGPGQTLTFNEGLFYGSNP
jgi:hypothetical protein